eukprot:2143425-Lingulodinium_polyedra.AAC.1
MDLLLNDLAQPVAPNFETGGCTASPAGAPCGDPCATGKEVWAPFIEELAARFSERPFPSASARPASSPATAAT